MKRSVLMDEKMLVQFIQRPAAACHEAGHAVVAIALGIKVAAVSIDETGRGCTEMDDAARLLPDRVWEYTRSRTQLYSMLRSGLVIHVAGHVANYLCDQWCCFGEWPTAKQMREESNEWDWDNWSHTLVSNCFQARQNGATPDADFSRAVMTGRTIVSVKLQEEKPLSQEPGNEPEPFDIPSAKVLGEILRAERSAAKLLKQHWQAVLDIAKKLMKSRSGRLAHRPLMKPVGHHFGRTEVGTT
jgi:hypothetical protein